MNKNGQEQEDGKEEVEVFNIPNQDVLLKKSTSQAINSLVINVAGTNNI